MASKYLPGSFYQSGGYGSIFLSRNFTTFVTAGSKDMTIPALTLTGAFVIEYDATFLGSATSIVLGDSLSSADYVASTTSGPVRLRINATNVTTSPATLDEKLRHVKVERDGSDNITITVSGFAPENLGTLAGDFTTDLIGAIGSGGHWEGVIANVSITDVADRKRFYKIDETWDGPSTVLVDYGSDGLNGTAVNITSADSEPFTKAGVDWLGVGLWTHGDISASSATSGFVGSVSVTVVDGYIYKFTYEVDNYVTGSTTAIATAAGTNRAADGIYSDIITSTGTTAGWDVATNPTTLDVNNGEIKRILEGI